MDIGVNPGILAGPEALLTPTLNLEKGVWPKAGWGTFQVWGNSPPLFTNNAAYSSFR